MSIEINGRHYDAQKMPPREQLHVLRRLTPIMTSMGGAAAGLLDEDMPKEQVIAALMQSIGPISESLAAMKDEELDYVMNACLLRATMLDVDDKWHPIYTRGPRGVIAQYQHLDLASELRIVAEVIKVNLTGFFSLMSAGAES